MMCALCHWTFTDHASQSHNRMMFIRVLGPLFRRGLSYRAAERLSGFSSGTIHKYFKFFKEWKQQHGIA